MPALFVALQIKEFDVHFQMKNHYVLIQIYKSNSIANLIYIINNSLMLELFEYHFHTIMEMDNNMTLR